MSSRGCAAVASSKRNKINFLKPKGKEKVQETTRRQFKAFLKDGLWKKATVVLEKLRKASYFSLNLDNESYFVFKLNKTSVLGSQIK